MTTDRLATLVANLRRFEGAVPWMYLDNAAIPNVTVGIGVMLSSAGDAVALPFVDLGTGQAATENDVAQAFARVRMMRSGMAASYYKGVSGVELPDAEVTALAERRLMDVFLPGLTEILGPGGPSTEPSRFDLLPWPAQQAFVDMAWNLGLGGLTKFQRLIRAARAGAWSAAAAESHVSTSRPERNDWRAEMFRSC